jgi:DNA polymerase III epsilon subunit-like protein
MIIVDTETTGFTKPMSVPLDQQPEIIEFAALKLNDATLKEEACINFLIQPRVLPLGPETIKATKITDDMVKSQPRFPQRVKEIVDFFFGERTVVGHNLGYDLTMMQLELARLMLLTKFPWPPVQICTVELTMDLEAPRQKSDRLKLSELYKLVTGHEPDNKHRALDDCRSLAECVAWLRAKDARI